MSVHCPLRVLAFETSTIKLLCLEVVKEFDLKNCKFDEFDPLGRQICSLHLYSVKENKESALEAQNQLREEILGKLEDTNKSIDQVNMHFQWKLGKDVRMQMMSMRKYVYLYLLQVSGDLVSGLDGVTSK